jgi:hypothetical protein
MGDQVRRAPGFTASKVAHYRVRQMNSQAIGDVDPSIEARSSLLQGTTTAFPPHP